MRKNRLYMSIREKLRDAFWRNLALLSPGLATILWYRRVKGFYPNLTSPTLLSEKLQKLKIGEYFNNPLVTQCADKLRVRDYVRDVGCGEILNELYHVFNSPDDIEWDILPEEFVLKCNHGCGSVLVCRQKEALDAVAATDLLRKWYGEEYGLERVEYSYRGIEKRVICEKLIRAEAGELPKDIKIFCSFGEPVLAYVISERNEDGGECLDYFTADWEWLPVRNGTIPNAREHPQKPRNWEQLCQYASILSEPFPIVRVDLYNEFGKVIFGELTFLPTGGTFLLDPPEYDKAFGKLFAYGENTPKAERKARGQKPSYIR